jgi:hypothetical protein
MIPLTVDEAGQWLDRGDSVQLLCEASPWPVDQADGDARSSHFKRRSFEATSGKMPIRVVVILVAQVRGRCPHLLPDLRCGIYETRPLVCRIYPAEVNPWIAMRPATKACPPEAWSNDRSLLQRDGVIRNDVIAGAIGFSRDSDAGDVTVKCRIADSLGIMQAGLVHDAVLVFSPSGMSLSHALSRAQRTEAQRTDGPVARTQWQFVTDQATTLEQLTEQGFNARDSRREASRDFEFCRLSRTPIFGPYL